jgi:hypothetical protein
MSEWISVKDRLPEIGIPVLICDMKGVTMDDRGPEVAFWDESKCFCSTQDFDFILNATHWQPLPNPPEVKDDE